MKWDVFISYAGENKQRVATPLAVHLSNLGFKVWYADRILKIGDSLRAKIDEGLANSRYGVVILSHDFFQKHWPQKELDALVSLQAEQGNPILPVLHGMTQKDLVRQSPLLASVLHISTEIGIETVARKIADILSSATIRLAIDKSTCLTFLADPLSEDLEECVRLTKRREDVRIEVFADASLLLNDLYPRLNECEGQRFSHSSPEEDYEKVVEQTENIFTNIKELVRLCLSVYCRQLDDPPMLADTIQRFAKLTCSLEKPRVYGCLGW